jgi:pyruvate kinase
MVIFFYQGPEVRSGDLPQPINLESGQEFTFTIRRGVGTTDCVSVNYDDFVNDVEVGDMLLVDGTHADLICLFIYLLNFHSREGISFSNVNYL